MIKRSHLSRETQRLRSGRSRPTIAMLVKAPVQSRRKANSVPAAMPPARAHGRDGDRCARGCRRLQSVRRTITTITADYDAQSAVERELVLRLASLPWRLRRATTMETGLFEIRADHLSQFRQPRHCLCAVRAGWLAELGPRSSTHGITNEPEAVPSSVPDSVEARIHPNPELARLLAPAIPNCSGP
jgi:hypothetical protein